MSFITDWKHAAESEAFNWKCMICSVVALSPMFVEDQWLVQYGPHKDIDGVTLWLKCSECCTPYLKCLQNSSEISFKLSILLPHFNSCLALIILLFVCFSFSFIMSRGHGKGRGRGHGSGHPPSSKPVPVSSKLQKGRKLNEWKTESNFSCNQFFIII